MLISFFVFYNFIPTTLCQQLLHRYSFNDGTGYDSVGTAHGSLNSGASVSSGWLSLSLGAFLRLPQGLLGSYPDITVELWFSASATNTNCIKIFSFGDGTSNCPSIACYQNYASGPTSTWISCNICGPSSTPDYSVSTTNSYVGPSNVHLVAVYSTSSNALTMYVNGNLVGSTSLGALTIPGRAASDFLAIGKSAQGTGMIGSFDEFRIWSGVLTASTVSAQYAAGSNRFTEGKYCEISAKKLIASQ